MELQRQPAQAESLNCHPLGLVDRVTDWARDKLRAFLVHVAGVRIGPEEWGREEVLLSNGVLRAE